MRPWGTVDVLIWLTLAFVQTIALIGPFGALYFVLGFVPFLLVVVPWNLFQNFKVRTWDRRPNYSRLASPFEYAAAITARYLLQNFNPREMGPALFGRETAEAVFKSRQSVLTREGLGDVEHYALDPEQKLSGLWVEPKKSPFCADNDVVVFYIVGPGLFGESAQWNLEFFHYLVVSLDQQGFITPAIFVADASNAADWKQAMDIVIADYAAVSGAVSRSLVISGHAGGATLALSLLLHRAKPFDDLSPLPPTTRAPDAAVLISPVMDLYRHRHPSNREIDYLSVRALQRYQQNYAPSHTGKLAYARPGLVADLDLWRQAMPANGLFISAGSEEVLLAEIREFAYHLKDLRKVALEVESGQIHAWPLWLVYTARTRVEMTAGINRIACQISQMQLWESVLS